jgi:flagellar basal-body rod protein FlgB
LGGLNLSAPSEVFRVIVTPLSDVTTQTLSAAIYGVGLERQAHQDNIANLETPGYLAQTVSFRSSLERALGRGEPTDMNPTFARSQAATNMNGNNVDIAGELVALEKAQLDQSLLVEALNAKYRLLRTSISGT